MLILFPDIIPGILLEDSLFYKDRLNEKNKTFGGVSPDDVDLS